MQMTTFWSDEILAQRQIVSMKRARCSIGVKHGRLIKLMLATVKVLLNVVIVVVS